MRGVYTDEVIDPPPNEQLYLEEGSENVELRNLALDGWTFYLRGSTDILIEGGEVGNTVAGENCKVGAAYQSDVLCERITIRGIRFHDMVTNDPAQHHEALFVCDSDDVLIEDCVFEGIWGNTADLYFTAEQTLHLASNVVIRGNHFRPPTNGSRRDAIQWHDKLPAPEGMAPINGYTLIGNLFEDCSPNFGTIKRPVSNFYVGVNYGVCPESQYEHALSMGVEFEEYPFRPAEEWPGHGEPGEPDPCSAVIEERDALQARIDEAIAILEGAP